MAEAFSRDAKAAHVEAYKNVLRDILNQRPSGTRLRLANALGKNRSFISHMANPVSSTPIPAPHLEILFEICHFSPADRRGFLKSYDLAHPHRFKPRRDGAGLRALKLEVLDFGDEKRNRAFDDLIRDTARRFARLVTRSE